MFDHLRSWVCIFASAALLVSFVGLKIFEVIDSTLKNYFQVLSQQEKTSDEECYALISVVESFNDCCDYPYLNSLSEDSCWDKCETADDYVCCFELCYMISSKFIVATTDAQGNFSSSDYDWLPIYNSFMSSVPNASEIWQPVISNVVQRCYDQFAGSGSGYRCEIIPLSFDEVVHCTYKQVFLQCPVWNQNGLNNCSNNYEWVVKCW